MKKLVLGKSHDQDLIGSPAEATKLALKIDDFVEKFLIRISLETNTKIYGLFANSRYGGALWIGLGSWELHSIGSTKKYEAALRNFWDRLETIANMSSQLKVYGKTLFYFESGSGKACSYLQHSLTTGANLETFISFN